MSDEATKEGGDSFRFTSGHAMVLATVISIGQGFVAYGILTTRVGTNETALAAHVLKSDEDKQRLETEVAKLRDKLTQLEQDVNGRLIRVDDGIESLKTTVAHMDGLLGGSNVQSAKGRGR